MLEFEIICAGNDLLLNISSDPINTDWLLTYRLMYILEIRCRGSTVAELSKLIYVEN